MLEVYIYSLDDFIKKENNQTIKRNVELPEEDGDGSGHVGGVEASRTAIEELSSTWRVPP